MDHAVSQYHFQAATLLFAVLSGSVAVHPLNSSLQLIEGVNWLPLFEGASDYVFNCWPFHLPCSIWHGG